VAAILMAVPAFVVTSFWAVPIMLIAYALANNMPVPFKRLVNAPLIQYIFIIGSDLARATVFHNWMTRAEDVLVLNPHVGSLLIGFVVASSGFVLHSLVMGVEPDLNRVPSRFILGVLLSRAFRFALGFSRTLAHASLALFFVMTGLAQ